MARIFSYSGRHAKISLEFTDKVPFFVDLSVSKMHFTDKKAFYSDLSVNFWPLWWRFTDKAGFLEHLSVKPGPKRLNFYGQTAIFDHFVRKRHFSIEPFTDSMPIFIDVSVNNRDFAKCSAAQHLLNQCTWLRLRAPSFGVGGRQKSHIHPGFCLLSGSRGPILESAVEHFFNFWEFYSTFEVARAEFVGGGRTFSQFWMILFYSRSSAGRICRRR